MTRDEFYEKWDDRAIYSQTACNPTALLYSAREMISDWREAGGDFQGKDCPHLKFLLFQIVFLVFGREMDWPEWFEEYDAIEARLKGSS